VAPAVPPVKPTPDTPADLAAVAYSRGRKLAEESKLAEALEQFTKAILLDPKFTLAFNARGYAYFRLKRYKEAVEDLDEALKLNPYYANAYQNRSAARRALGDKSGADADLAKAKELLTPPAK
jgi:tetratricopeptide (TPR) repeat protein